MYGHRRLHRTCDGVNRSSGCGVPPSARIWCSIEIPARAQRPITMPLHVYQPKKFHKTWDGANSFNDYGVAVLEKHIGTRWEFLQGPDRLMTFRCTSMSQDGSTELEKVQISPTVVELQHLQELGCPMAIPARTRQASDNAVAYLWANRVPQNLMALTCTVVVEYQCPQSPNEQTSS